MSRGHVLVRKNAEIGREYIPTELVMNEDQIPFHSDDKHRIALASIQWRKKEDTNSLNWEKKSMRMTWAAAKVVRQCCKGSEVVRHEAG